jgi:peptidoglycan/LPS O-acetylase OafA/YrhL
VVAPAGVLALIGDRQRAVADPRGDAVRPRALQQPVPEAAPAARNLGLDLIRALAIGLVLLSHFTDLTAAFTGGHAPPWLSIAGLFGVELFFVLSGFLIGGILLRLARARPDGSGPGWRDWLVFMLRRWLRTLPLYLLWVAVLALALPPPAGLAEHLARYLTLTQNLCWPMPADNWFAVSWSLTVEEWFYLTFSAALLGVAALTRGRWAAWAVIAAFIAIPLAIRLLTPPGADFMVAAYKTAALRLDAIAYGVALAALRPARWRRAWPALAAGLSLLGLLWAQASVAPWAIPLTVFFPLLPTATAVGCALLFPAALRLRAGRGLLAGAIRQLSAQSYSLYLIHLSVLDFMWRLILPHHLPRLAAAPLALLLTFTLSWLLWRFIEQPILARRPTRLGLARVAAA